MLKIYHQSNKYLESISYSRLVFFADVVIIAENKVKWPFYKNCYLIELTISMRTWVINLALKFSVLILN